MVRTGVSPPPSFHPPSYHLPSLPIPSRPNGDTVFSLRLIRPETFLVVYSLLARIIDERADIFYAQCL